MDNIKMDIRKIACDNRKWIELSQVHVQMWTLILVALNTGFCCHCVDYLDKLYMEVKWFHCVLCLSNSLSVTLTN